MRATALDVLAMPGTRGKPRGSGPLQQPVKFRIEHSKKGTIVGAMSTAAFRTLNAILDNVEPDNTISTNRKILMQETHISRPLQTHALRELIDDVGFLTVLRASHGSIDTVYAVRVRRLKQGDRDRRFAYVDGCEPDDVPFAQQPYGALVYLELPATSRAEASAKVADVLSYLRVDVPTAKLMKIERIEDAEQQAG